MLSFAANMRPPCLNNGSGVTGLISPRRSVVALLTLGMVSSAVAAERLTSHLEDHVTAYPIEAPDDVFVTSIIADGQVTKGQTIAMLESPALERLITRLNGLKGHLAIALRPFSDGRIAAQISEIKQKATAYQQGENAAHDDVTYMNGLTQTSAGDAHDFYQSQIKLASVTGIYDDAILEASQIDKKVQDAHDGLNVANDQLAKEEALLQEMRARMTVQAPVAGRFVAKTLTSLFVRKGHLLGTINV